MTHQNSEKALLYNLIESHAFDAKDVSVETLEDMGYIVQLGSRISLKSDWIFYDLDDTIIASWQAKDERLAKYLKYCRSLNSNLSDKCLLEIFDMTDEHVRWVEVDKPIYHFYSHVTLLGDVFNILVSNKDYGDQKVLSAVGKYVQSQPQEPTLVISGEAERLTQIIFPEVVKPAIFNDATNSMTALHAENLGIGIFTYGEPYFQLLKTLQLMHRSASLRQAVSQIWLTKTSKGNFLSAASETFGGRVLVIDDSPAELDDIHVNFNGHSARLHLIRSLRNGTKTTAHQWDTTDFNHSVFDARVDVSPNALLAHIRQTLEQYG